MSNQRASMRNMLETAKRLLSFLYPYFFWLCDRAQHTQRRIATTTMMIKMTAMIAGKIMSRSSPCVCSCVWEQSIGFCMAAVEIGLAIGKLVVGGTLGGLVFSSVDCSSASCCAGECNNRVGFFSGQENLVMRLEVHPQTWKTT